MISAVAEMYEIHPQTLRLYEREGLLKPSRTEGNTRLYTDEDLERLEFILNLARDLGVNIAGIAIILQMRERMEEMNRQMQSFVDYVRSRDADAVPAGAPPPDGRRHRAAAQAHGAAARGSDAERRTQRAVAGILNSACSTSCSHWPASAWSHPAYSPAWSCGPCRGYLRERRAAYARLDHPSRLYSAADSAQAIARRRAISRRASHHLLRAGLSRIRNSLLRAHQPTTPASPSPVAWQPAIRNIPAKFFSTGEPPYINAKVAPWN